MNIAVIFQVIIAALKFPEEMTAFIKALEKTPEEKHADLVAEIEKQAASFADTGRPS